MSDTSLICSNNMVIFSIHILWVIFPHQKNVISLVSPDSFVELSARQEQYAKLLAELRPKAEQAVPGRWAEQPLGSWNSWAIFTKLPKKWLN